MQEIKLPQLGQSVEEASIVTWYKNEGDSVERDEPLCSIQTDKAEIDFESPAAGTLRKILLPADVTAPVMTVMALIGESDERLPDLSQYGAQAGAGTGESEDDNLPEIQLIEERGGTQEDPRRAAIVLAERLGIDPADVPARGATLTPDDVVHYAQSSGITVPMAPESSPEFLGGAARAVSNAPGDELDRLLDEALDTSSDDGDEGKRPLPGKAALASATAALGDLLRDEQAGAGRLGGKLRASPVARRLAQLHGVDLVTLSGTGPKGRIVKADVLRAKEAAPASPQPVRRPEAAPAAAAAQPAPGATRLPLTPMRKIIAQRMSESKYAAPHYYMTIEVDMRKAAEFRQTCTFRPSYNDLVLYAVARAIEEHPMVNARWAGDAIELVSDVNLGCAVALPQGLIVPVIRGAQGMSLEELSAAVKSLVEKARTNKLTPDDYTGNTFTVSNLGVFGVDHFTAIINQPDSAILAVGQIKERPVVLNGGIHIRPIMKLTLSSDHRVIDGAVAAQFMGTLRVILDEARF